MPSFLIAMLAAQAAAAASPAPPPAAAEDKVRCRRIEETGSLVTSRKECHTEREWREIARRAQDDFGRLQGRGFKGGGN